MRIAIAALVAAACQAKAVHSPRTFHVDIRGMAYVPASLSVDVGDIVVWTNRDIVPHTATAAGWFDSGTLSPHQQWSYVVSQPIDYAYVCTLHPTMNARIVGAPRAN